MCIFLSDGPVPCILVSICNPVNCIIARHGCVLCHRAVADPATSLDVCPWRTPVGEHVSSGGHRSAHTQPPLAPQKYRSVVVVWGRRGVQQGVGWRGGGELVKLCCKAPVPRGHMSWQALPMLVAEPPCDFMLKCHEMRHRNSTGFPGRSVICSMLSRHDASMLGLLLLGQLCVGRVKCCGRGRRGRLCVQSRASCISAKSFCVESLILLHMLFLKQIIYP